MTRGAIILCGGQSTRMGRDKARLPFGPDELMLQRVVRLVGDVVEPERIVVVAAVGQELPELPETVRIARDRQPERGPLEGLAAGLRALGGCKSSTTLRVVNHGTKCRATPLAPPTSEPLAEAAFVTSCDVPLLVPAFVERLFELLDEAEEKRQVSGGLDIVVPREDRFHHPLSAVYRTDVLVPVDALLAADQLRMRYLFEECRTLEVPVCDLRDVDPNLDSLSNCNRPEEYAAALARCGFAVP